VLIELFQQQLHAWEQGGVTADILNVEAQQILAFFFKPMVIWLDTKTKFDQRNSTVRDGRPDLFQ